MKLTTHQGKIEKLVGLIYPTGPATAHPAANILLEFGTKGCPVNCGPDWSPEQIKAAIEYAAHPSAQIPEAAAQLRNEAVEKVEQGYAKLVYADDIMVHPPRQLKVAPIAAVPHKTQGFRAILDLTFILKQLEEQWKSANSAN